MSGYFVRIRAPSRQAFERLLQMSHLDTFRHTAREMGSNAFEVEALLSTGQVAQLRADGYQVEMIADADRLADQRRPDVDPPYS